MCQGCFLPRWLQPLPAINTIALVTTKCSFRHPQIFPRGQNCPCLTTTEVVCAIPYLLLALFLSLTFFPPSVATTSTQVCVCVRVGQRKALDMGPCLLCCLRQDFLFTIMCVKLAAWKSSRNSLCLSLPFHGWMGVTAAALPELRLLIYLSSRLYSPSFFLVLRVISFSVVNHVSIVPNQPSVTLCRWPSQEHNTLPDCFLFHHILMNYLSPG